MPSQLYRRNAELMEAELGDDLVALDAEAGNCFGFNAVAASVWRALEQPRSFDDLRDRLLEEYEVDADQCSAELRLLLEDLTSHGLIAKS